MRPNKPSLRLSTSEGFPINTFEHPPTSGAFSVLQLLVELKTHQLFVWGTLQN